VEPRAILDAVVKRKIPSPHGNRTLEPRSSSPLICAYFMSNLFMLSLQYFEKSICLWFRPFVSVLSVLLLLHLSVCFVSL
jgi:hypothetical protein